MNLWLLAAQPNPTGAEQTSPFSVLLTKKEKKIY